MLEMWLKFQRTTCCRPRQLGCKRGKWRYSSSSEQIRTLEIPRSHSRFVYNFVDIVLNVSHSLPISSKVLWEKKNGVGVVYEIMQIVYYFPWSDTYYTQSRSNFFTFFKLRERILVVYIQFTCVHFSFAINFYILLLTRPVLARNSPF